MSTPRRPPSTDADFYFSPPLQLKPPSFKPEITSHQTLSKGYCRSTTDRRKIAKTVAKATAVVHWFSGNLAITTSINPILSTCSTFFTTSHRRLMNQSLESKPVQNCSLYLQISTKTPPFRAKYHHHHTHRLKIFQIHPSLLEFWPPSPVT